MFKRVQYRCECYGNCFKAALGGVVCSCGVELAPLPRDAAAERLACQIGPRAPSGSSVIQTRTDDRSTPTLEAQKEPGRHSGQTYLNAMQVAAILTEYGFSVTDATVSAWCRQGIYMKL